VQLVAAVAVAVHVAAALSLNFVVAPFQEFCLHLLLCASLSEKFP